MFNETEVDDYWCGEEIYHIMSVNKGLYYFFLKSYLDSEISEFHQPNHD